MKYLEIEFAGICCLAYEKGKKRGTVYLVDVPSALTRLQKQHKDQGFEAHSSPHFPLMVVPRAEDDQIAGEFALSTPGNPKEYVGWNLSGLKLKFHGAETSVLSLARDTSKEPLVELNEPTGATGLVKQMPVSARVNLPGGKVEACEPPADTLPCCFTDGTDSTAPRRYALRFKVTIPFKTKLKIQVSKGRKTTTLAAFKETTEILISNLCQEGGANKNHFFAYYALLAGKPKVPEFSVKEPKVGAKAEGWPRIEECSAAVVVL